MSQATIFQLILWLTFLSSALCVAFDVTDEKRLSKSLTDYKEKFRLKTLDELSGKPLQLFLVRFIVFGYFIVLIILAFKVPYAEYLFVVFTIGWTWTGYRCAPTILSGLTTIFYELSLGDYCLYFK